MVLESRFVSMLPVKIKGVGGPVAVFATLTQAKLLEILVYPGVLYAYLGVSVICCCRHISFEDVVIYFFMAVVELILHTTVRRMSWCLDFGHGKIDWLALEAHHSDIVK